MSALIVTERGVVMATASAVRMHGFLNWRGLFIALLLASLADLMAILRCCLSS